VLVAAGVFFVSTRHARALTDKDTVVLSEFVNTTGDSVFDGTLKQALAVQLDQSPYLNLLPDSRVQEALRFMGRKPDERITKDLAGEISLRANAKAIISGSIASLGSNYVITLEATNAQTGDSLARQQAEAPGKEQVLKSLDKAATNLRTKLGESLSSVQQYATPLEQATTSSLEALKEFSLGQALHDRLEDVPAVPHFQRAIELDPNFAMAYAVQGVASSNLGSKKESVEYLKKAYELRDRASERERFYITGHYYDLVTGELDKVVDLYQQWMRIYPRDNRPVDNLALAYSTLGEHEKALAAATDAVRLDPQDTYAYQNQMAAFLSLNRVDEAKAVAQTAEAQNRGSVTTHLYLVYVAALQQDDTAMRAQLDWAAGKPVEPFIKGRFILYQESLGKSKLAGEMLAENAVLAAKYGLTEYPRNLWSVEAIDDATYGLAERARGNAAEALKVSASRLVRGSAAVAYALNGDIAASRKLIEELNAEAPSDFLLQFHQLPAAKALLLLRQNEAAKSVGLLEPSRKYDFGEPVGASAYLVMYVRGLAYLQLNDGAKAGAEFQKILDHPGINSVSCFLPMARLNLARAYSHQNDTAKARIAYQNFLALWKDADPDVPVLIAAKAEYAKLH
jgi:tetratricopeptide (TPR) repeat protein